jgi:hypothetical protein
MSPTTAAGTIAIDDEITRAATAGTTGKTQDAARRRSTGNIMSRRAIFFALAASAALIATPAAADPECFGQPCHLPEAVEPPPAAVLMPETADATAPEALAAVPKPAPVKALPPVTVAQEEPPQPMARRPLPSIKPVAESANARVEPVKLAPRHLKDAPKLSDVAELKDAPLPPVAAASHAASAAAPAGPVRVARVASADPSYVVGYNAPVAGGIVVVVPGATYAAGQRPTYLFAPNAKIISIESDD